MNNTQRFYDNLAPHYKKLFFNWDKELEEQAVILDKIFSNNGFDKNSLILDCACGIGTQALGLAALGYNLVASDIGTKAMIELKWEAVRRNFNIRFEHADFCNLSNSFKEQFDIIIAMDNALPHMLSRDNLKTAIESIVNQLVNGGMFVASIRDYDALLDKKPSYSPPYIHKKDDGQCVSFQTWEWEDEKYKLVQYIIEDEHELKINKFECEYRATRRSELTELLLSSGCSIVEWKFPEETGFYQPIVIAKK